MTDPLPPANTWSPTAGCSSDGQSNPSFAYGVILTGVPAMIAATTSPGYVWSITLNDGATPPNFTIDRYDASGNLIDHPIVASGADGSVTFNDPVYLSEDPAAPNQAATKAYVDTRAPLGGPYLPSAGGFLSGAMALNGSTSQRFIGGLTPGVPGNPGSWRWNLILGDTTAESGGNSGSNYVLQSFNDAGGSPVARVTMTRNGQATFNADVAVQGQVQLADPSKLALGGGTSGQVLTTDGAANLLWSTPSGGGGIPDAPIDGNLYGRFNATWAVVPPAAISTDAPNNASTYGRSGGAWVVVPPPVIATDAPATSLYYARYNNGWVNIASGFLALGGGTLTGALTLAANPTAPLQPATKQYADTIVASYLPLAGGALTGALTLAADPAAALGAATKQYVDAGDATRLPLAGGTLTGALNGTTGTFTSTLSGSAQSQVRAIGTGNASFVVFDSANNAKGTLGWQNATGNSLYLTNVATGNGFNFDGASQFNITGGTGVATKPGGGNWTAPSDERIKTVLGDYTPGLEEVQALHPVAFVYKGNDTPSADVNDSARGPDDPEPTSNGAPYPASPHYDAAVAQTQFVGFVAQELEAIFPGMVSQREGYIDGEKVTDLRDVDTSNLVYALVNAVKTLAARVSELEAASG